MCPQSASGVQITSTDLWLLAILTRYQGTTMPVIQRHLFPGLHRTGIYRRLRRLIAAGLLENLTSGPSNRARPRSLRTLYVPTRGGSALAGSHLKAQAISVATAEHTVAISEVGLIAEGAGLTVWTDREIQYELTEWRQSSDARAPERRLWLGAYDGFHLSLRERATAKRTIRTHRPDLVIVDERRASGERVAVEIEFSTKGSARLTRILRWYAREGVFDVVRYVVRDAAAKRRVERAVESLPESKREMFRVVVYEPRHGEEVKVEQSPLVVPIDRDLPDLPEDGQGSTPTVLGPASPEERDRLALGAEADDVSRVRRNALPTRPPSMVVTTPGEKVRSAEGEARAPQDALPEKSPLGGTPAVEGIARWWCKSGAPGMWGDLNEVGEGPARSTADPESDHP